MRVRLFFGFMAAVGLGWMGIEAVGAAPQHVPTSPARPPVSTGTPIVSSTTPLPDLETSLVVEGFDRPTFAVPLGEDRLLVTEKRGVIWLVDGGEIADEPFLDLRGFVARGADQGLLAAAVHPEFAENGRFFVHLTDRAWDSRLIEYRVSNTDPYVADPRSARLIMETTQPGEFHNGGMVAFGPDGYLYVAMGDGDFGDSDRNARLLQNRLGAVLRIDVDTGGAYSIPSDNPYVGTSSAAEIWASGLRNPWRFFIDNESRSIVIGDVGQFNWEEVEVASLDEAGLDFGWPVIEGRQCYQDPDCETEGLVLPDIVYSHGKGCAIVAGPIYRGSLIPELQGMVVYADYCTGSMGAYSLEDGAVRRNVPIIESGLYGPILSLAVDHDGEILLLTEKGEIRRLRPAG